jgi:TolB protein
MAMRRRVLALVFLLSLPVAAQQPTTLGYFRFPALTSDALVFTAEGDLWRVGLAGGVAQRLTTHAAEESRPAVSPDGRTLAVTLSREGGSQIFLMNPDGSNVRRLTSSPAIDTEPRYSPDGRWLYFTSDRGGTPQIYRVPMSGGDPQRVTFEGSYNVSPRISPDGNKLAYITRNSGRFQVALLDLTNQQTQVITDSERDESPSFAPNGQMILLATVLGGRGVLSAVSSDGRFKQRLSAATGGDVREPAWGPFIE